MVVTVFENGLYWGRLVCNKNFITTIDADKIARANKCFYVEELIKQYNNHILILNKEFVITQSISYRGNL